VPGSVGAIAIGVLAGPRERRRRGRKRARRRRGAGAIGRKTGVPCAQGRRTRAVCSLRTRRVASFFLGPGVAICLSGIAWRSFAIAHLRSHNPGLALHTHATASAASRPLYSIILRLFPSVTAAPALAIGSAQNGPGPGRPIKPIPQSPPTLSFSSTHGRSPSTRYLLVPTPLPLQAYPRYSSLQSTMPDASNPPAHLVALPSLSSHLSSLPQAKSMANVPLYNTSMSSMGGHHAAQSEAKVRPLSRLTACAHADVSRPFQLRKALSQSSHSGAPAYAAYAMVRSLCRLAIPGL
jgi:hypothetical protein